MINLWKIRISHIKTGIKLTEVEVIGSDKESMEKNNFYKNRAMVRAGYDTTTEKWEIEKFKFEAELIKNLDGEITIK